MTGITYTKQREALQPTAAPVGPAMAMLVPMGDHGWHDGIANPWECGTNGTIGFTAKRSPRRLGRFPT
jgi:hypothetical protein